MAAVPKRSLGARLYDNAWIALFRRLLVSAIIAGPFLLGGAYGFFVGDFPPWASLVVLGVGAVLMFLGLYMSFTGIVPFPPLTPGAIRPPDPDR